MNAPAKLDLPARLVSQAGGDSRPLTDKNVQWVRVTATGYGKVWLFYNAFVGGDEDEGEDPAWFEIWYRGYFLHEGERAFGHFAVRVEGSGLDKVIYQLAVGVLTTLGEGRQKGFAAETVISRVTLTPFEVDV